MEDMRLVLGHHRVAWEAEAEEEMEEQDAKELLYLKKEYYHTFPL